MATNAVEKKAKADVAPVERRSVLGKMASRYGVDTAKFLDTLKNTVFKNATNEQLMALCIVADQYKLNPFLKEIYAFPDKKSGGIVPVVGIDGWLRIINEHPQFDGMEIVTETDDACTVKIYRKDRQHPTTLTEYLAEVKRDTEPWRMCPNRMLRHKTIIQCARVAFGFGGIKDPDEAERIIEAESVRLPISEPKAKAFDAVVIEPTRGEPAKTDDLEALL
jgi:hypothetical protein